MGRSSSGRSVLRPISRVLLAVFVSGPALAVFAAPGSALGPTSPDATQTTQLESPRSTLEVDSPPRMQPFDPAGFTEQAADLPAGLVAAVRRDLGLAPEEYLANAAAAKAAGDVLAHLGDDARAGWLDGQTLHVVVDDRSGARAARATGAEVHVGDALVDALDAARAQDKVAYVDREASRVVPVDETLTGEPVQRPRLLAQADWRGGNGFALGDRVADYHCSTAFAGTDGDGRQRVLTAGHCATGSAGPLTSPVHHLDVPAPIFGEGDLADTWPDFIGAKVGEIVEDGAAFGAGNDVALIDISAPGWTVLPEVRSWGGEKSGPDALPIFDSIDAVAGAPACSSGVTSGWTCGTIVDAGTTVPVSGEDVTGFLFDACVLPGDSGGPVVVGNYALGVNSGSTWRAPTCDAGAGAAAGSGINVGFAVSGETASAEAVYGDQWELLVHVGAPVVTSPGEGATVDSRPTLSGTVRAAAGATVAVSVDDGAPLRTTVSPTGRWAVTVDTELSPGTHTYTVRASHTPAAGRSPVMSRTTTGSFVVAKATTLEVSRPQPGQEIPPGDVTFAGTGQPGATVTLTLDGETHGSTRVGDDGSWSILTERTEPGRMEAVLTQRSGGSSSSRTVPDVGVVPAAPLITNPRTGAEVAPDHTFTGVGVVGATVSVVVSEADDGSELSPMSAQTLRVQTDARGIWEVQLEGPLDAGVRKVVATQSVEDLTSEPSTEVAFTVTEPRNREGGDIAGGDAGDDLAGTGTSSLGSVLAGAALVLTAGAMVVALARRGDVRG